MWPAHAASRRPPPPDPVSVATGPDSPPVPLVAQCQHGFRTAVEPGELRCRMQAAGIDAEWADICRDLNALTETEIEQNGKRFLVRSATRGSVAAILRCAGARLPQTIRQVEPAEQEEAMPATA